MTSPEVTMLLEMGFSLDRAEKALSITGNKGVEPAMEWLLSNPEEEAVASTSTADTADPANPTEPINSEDAPETSAEETPGEAKSLKCEECNKLFKTQLEVEYHAAKSGHSSFSESTEEKKPLTEEQRQEQLRLIDEKMKQKRREREEKEKSDALDREKKRIQSGKEMSAMREKMKDDEMKKIIEQRKKEKIEDQQARQRVKEQIEADKAARKAKFGMATAEAPPPAPVVNVVDSKPQVHKDYTEARLQIRLTNGQSLTHTFGSREQLSAVRLYVEMNRCDSSEPFSLMTSFPKKIFTDEDFEKPLEALGLVPSAVIIVTKKP